ncbi:MAG: GIY-YIG nuclease family protein [Chitinophagaceae bacterium]|nr:GIY-YIG nuclease family protein [Chitinophagaceae bacterium]
MEQRTRQNCVYILKTGKNLYKIGKTRDLQKRLATYHTHLPILFRVVRQYPAINMDELEESLHIVFQHRRVKGEWFQLSDQELIICDNIARHYALDKLQKSAKTHRQLAGVRAAETEPAETHSTGDRYVNDPLLQVMEANEKYLRDYSRVAEDIKLGLSIKEIEALHEGAVSKATIQTVRRLLNYQTPNSAFLSEWFYIVNELEAGLSEEKILAKYAGLVTRSTIRMVRRILRNQLY